VRLEHAGCNAQAAIAMPRLPRRARCRTKK
jgi:hypothetical protein